MCAGECKLNKKIQLKEEIFLLKTIKRRRAEKNVVCRITSTGAKAKCNPKIMIYGRRRSSEALEDFGRIVVCKPKSLVALEVRTVKTERSEKIQSNMTEASLRCGPQQNSMSAEAEVRLQKLMHGRRIPQITFKINLPKC